METTSFPPDDRDQYHSINIYVKRRRLTPIAGHSRAKLRRDARHSHATDNAVENHPIGLTSHLFTICWARTATAAIGTKYGTASTTAKKIIGIEPAAKNDGVDMFKQAGVGAE